MKKKNQKNIDLECIATFVRHKIVFPEVYRKKTYRHTNPPLFRCRMYEICTSKVLFLLVALILYQVTLQAFQGGYGRIILEEDYVPFRIISKTFSIFMFHLFQQVVYS